jgi:hypothetical protein
VPLLAPRRIWRYRHILLRRRAVARSTVSDVPTFLALHAALQAQGWRRRGNAWHRDCEHLLRIRLQHGDYYTGHSFVLRYEPAPHPHAEEDLWSAYTEAEQKALLKRQREILQRHADRNPHLTALGLQVSGDDSLFASPWFVFYSDQEREEWAQHLLAPTLRALTVVWSSGEG